MPLYIGSKRIGDAYLGDRRVARIYHGENLVYEAFQAGSLVIEDDTLDVNGGSTVNLRVKLGARPRSDVTVALSETSSLISLGDSDLTFTPDNWDTYQSVAVAAAGNRQQIALQNGWYAQFGASTRYWRLAQGEARPRIDNALVPDGVDFRYFDLIGVQSDGDVWMSISGSLTGGDIDNQDLSSTFESSGGVDITFGGTTYSFNLNGADMAEPYFWRPTNSADAITLYNALGSATDRSATLVLRDYEPPDSPITISLSASGPDEYSSVTGSATVSVG